MFKLVSLTALVATTSASAASDEAAEKSKLHAEYEKQKAAAKKLGVTDSSKIWTEDTKAKTWTFMNYPDAKYTVTGAVEDQKCQDCFMTGNKWDATTKKCGVDTTAHEKADAIEKANKAAAEVDHTVTYKEWMTGTRACLPEETDLPSECHTTWTTTKLFEAGASTGKKDDKPYSWDYGYTGKVADAWSTCHYQAVMPYTTDKKGDRDYSWKGGLLLSHNLTPTQNIQAVVDIEAAGSVSYMYNSYTLSKLSVGKTNKVVIPAANTIDIYYTNTDALAAGDNWDISFKRQTNGQLAEFTLEHGGVIVWVIIGIVVFCLLCVGIIVWKKCFHKDSEAFYLEDDYARV